MIIVNALLIYTSDRRARRDGLRRVGAGRQSAMDRRAGGKRFADWGGLCFVGWWNRCSVHRLFRMCRCIAGSQMYAVDGEYRERVRIKADISISNFAFFGD